LIVTLPLPIARQARAWLGFLLLLLSASALAQQPQLLSAQTTGPGHYDVQITGLNFINSYVDTRPWSQNVDPTSYTPTVGTTGSYQTLTIRISDPQQRALLDGNGLGLWVVNRTNPYSWNSTPLRIQRDTSHNTPKISSVTTSGADGYTIVVRGTDFFQSYVDTRPWGTTVAPTSYSATLGSEGSQQTLTFTVTDPVQRSYLNGNGLGIWVVNLTSPAAWNQTPVRVQRTAVNQPPQINISSSVGTSTTAPGTFTINAQVNDPDGTVSRVRFYRSGVQVLDDTLPPFAWFESALAAGSYSYYAIAYDNTGASTTSNSVSVTVQTAVNNVPVVQDAQSIGADGYTIKVRGSNFINAYVDTRPWGQNVNPTSYSAVLGSEGSLQTLTFTITDPQQRAFLNTPGLGIHVVNTTNPPAWNPNAVFVQRTVAPMQISLSANPASGLFAPANVTITANTSGVSRVQFFRNGVLQLDDSSAPFQLSQTGLAAGTWTYTATAYNSSGDTLAATALPVTVSAPLAPLAGSYEQAGPISLRTSAVLFSKQLQNGTTTPVFIYSDGILIPSSNNRPAVQLGLYLNGALISNLARLDYAGADPREKHGYTLIAAQQSLPVGTHQLELRAVATGASNGPLTLSGNLSVMPLPVGTDLRSTHSNTDSGVLAFTTGHIAAGPNDDRSMTPEPLPHSLLFGHQLNTPAGQPIVSFAAGTYKQSGHDGDPLVGLWFNGAQSNSTQASWAINDLCRCAELVSPFMLHGVHSGTGAPANIMLGGAELYFSDQNAENPVRYRVESNSRVISFTAGALSGVSSGQLSHGNTSMLNTVPTANIDQVLATRTLVIPPKHDGEVFLSGKSRLFGGPGRGEGRLSLRINGNTVGLPGEQSCGSINNGCVSTRTLSTSYLATGANRLAPGTYTVELIGRFNTSTGTQHFMSVDGALLSFD
jgi:hypothetical protein